MRPTLLTIEDLEQVRNRLAQRQPDAPFTAAEAAIYTGRSTRTLKRAIDAGVGPRQRRTPTSQGWERPTDTPATGKRIWTPGERAWSPS